MNSEYKKAECTYKAIVEKLIAINIKSMSSSGKGQSYKRSIHISRDRSILPFIEPDPKTSFLTIAQKNVYTKDDPILRYVPAIKTTTPASISWYEGISVGEAQLSATDTINELFLKMDSEFTYASRLEYLRSTRKEKIDAPVPQKVRKKMGDAFCSVCKLFGCKMHSTQKIQILKSTETDKCICTEVLAENQYKTRYFESLNKIELGRCVLRRLHDLILHQKRSCNTFVFPNIPIKVIKEGRAVVKSKEFYRPCSHLGACSAGAHCPCAKKHRNCEAVCACISCKNMLFCDCKTCGAKCPCYANHRECTELCGCSSTEKMPQTSNDKAFNALRDKAVEIPIQKLRALSGVIKYKMPENTPETAGCNNRCTQRREMRKLMIKSSLYHGYGLFSEEFLKNGDFVIEYTGEIISDREAERRGNFYEINKCSYLFDLAFEKDECLYSIDAFFAGNKSRYINHSSKRANLRARSLEVGGLPRIAFYALCDIYPGEELFFDYHFSEDHKIKHGILD